jgi:hypothetical protein
MTEKNHRDPTQRRRAADMLVRTRIVEVLANLEPGEEKAFRVVLQRYIRNRADATEYLWLKDIGQAEEISPLIGQLSVDIVLDPPIVANVQLQRSEILPRFDEAEM